MKIPLVGVPDAPEMQRTFAPTSVLTFDKVAEAGVRLGNTIEGVASDLPVRIKTAIDQSTLAKVDAQAQAHFQGFVDSLQDGKNPQNNDPSTYLKRWTEAQSSFEDSMSQDNAVSSLSIAAKQQYKEQMFRWQTLKTQAVGHLATEKAVANGLADTRTAYEMKLQTGDTAGAEAVVETGMKTGIMGAEEGKQLIYQIPMKAEYNQAVQMMSRDPETGGGPIVLEKALREQGKDGAFTYFPHVTGQQRESLLFDAHRNATYLQSETAQNYAAQASAGQQPDPTRVATDLRLGKITAAQAAALLKPEKVFSPGAMSGMIGLISQYDPRADADHSKEAEVWGALNQVQPYLSKEANARLLDLFKDKVSDRSPLNSEAVKSVLKQNEELFHSGGYGKFSIKVVPTPAEMAERAKANPNDNVATPIEKHLNNVYTQAAIKKAEVDQKLFDFIRANPGSENDVALLTKQWASFSQAARGSAGVHLFAPPALAPSAPSSP